MKIYFIRHTTPDVQKGICYGQTDLDLVTTYSKEFETVLSQLPTSFDAVYSSPLKRCAKLAKAIDSNIVEDDRLQEMNFGDWEMKFWDDIPKEEIQPWFDDYVYTPAKNGESFYEMNTRVLEFYDFLRTQNHKTVAVVSHAGTMRCLLSHINEIPLTSSFEQIHVGYGGVVYAG